MQVMMEKKKPFSTAFFHRVAVPVGFHVSISSNMETLELEKNILIS